MRLRRLFFITLLITNRTPAMVIPDHTYKLALQSIEIVKNYARHPLANILLTTAGGYYFLHAYKEYKKYKESVLKAKNWAESFAPTDEDIKEESEENYSKIDPRFNSFYLLKPSTWNCKTIINDSGQEDWDTNNHDSEHISSYYFNRAQQEKLESRQHCLDAVKYVGMGMAATVGIVAIQITS